MNVGKLTPKSNNAVRKMRFAGGFGQPDGFGSVLEVRLNKAGDVSFGLTYRIDGKTEEHQWSVTLDNEQRHKLIEVLSPEYEPCKFEEIKE